MTYGLVVLKGREELQRHEKDMLRYSRKLRDETFSKKGARSVKKGATMQVVSGISRNLLEDPLHLERKCFAHWVTTQKHMAAERRNLERHRSRAFRGLRGNDPLPGGWFIEVRGSPSSPRPRALLSAGVCRCLQLSAAVCQLSASCVLAGCTSFALTLPQGRKPG